MVHTLAGETWTNRRTGDAGLWKYGAGIPRLRTRKLTVKDSVLMIEDHNAKLTVSQLAEALYEGTPHLQNLAEKLARQHGSAGALTFYGMMGDDVQNFWRGIAKQMIDHATEWEPNEGSACRLSANERARLKLLPRVPR
jgi:hypothetical protein